ncbi:High-affinity methionine permease [Pleurostoma richardsiae]|uniref:High-affinity methionine permease n=1 Tax=Pleurostoma richardsiae TaxID=41990 RepID=A0AA38R8X3_9PEZI|nr:High-affinity methionine permease [Pleurostoma richardsiae]
MSYWRRPFSSRTAAESGDRGEISDGSIKYVKEKGGNNAPPTYQEASGAPVEADSPLGYAVGPITITFMNISMMIGTGIYSTPSSILSGTGSVGLSFIYWTIGFLVSLASGCVYLEYTAYFPSRSGSEVAYLEQAYPRPTWFFPTTFAFQSVALSFASSNAIVLADYLFSISGHAGTDWEIKGVAVAGYTVVTILLIIHTRFSYYLSNAIGVVKILTLIFIVTTGFVVLGGHTSVADPKANFRNSFAGTGAAGAYGLTNALYRITFSYGGYNNAFNVVNEVKNPVQQLRRYAFVALFAVYVLYMFANVAWLSAVSKYDIENSGTTAASLFFTAVFGNSSHIRGLNFLIALSAFGNLLASALGASRMIRECGRQGVLPYPNFWSSTKPFGTPFGPYLVKWFLTILMILAIPTGDAFNFVSDLSVYPTAAFNLAMAIGLYIVRWRRKRAKLPRPQFRAWDPVVIFNILVQLYLLVMPWYPPAGGQYAGDVSFWYGTYIVTGIGILALCGMYYWLWAKLLPKCKGYELRQEVVYLENGAQTHKIEKVPKNEVAEWDATHDPIGRLRQTVVCGYHGHEKGVPESYEPEEKVGRIGPEITERGV